MTHSINALHAALISVTSRLAERAALPSAVVMEKAAGLLAQHSGLYRRARVYDFPSSDGHRDHHVELYWSAGRQFDSAWCSCQHYSEILPDTETHRPVCSHIVAALALARGDSKINLRRMN